jgi:hypothetical protein
MAAKPLHRVRRQKVHRSPAFFSVKFQSKDITSLLKIRLTKLTHANHAPKINHLDLCPFIHYAINLDHQQSTNDQ